MGSAMWMIELATKTITADSRIGSHKAVMGTIVPPLELALSTDAFHQKPQRVCPEADLSQALDRWIRRDVCSNCRRNLVSSPLFPRFVLHDEKLPTPVLTRRRGKAH